MTKAKEPVHFRELIRRRVRELRLEREWTQDEMAGRASQNHGLDWDRATVRHIEDGSRSVGDDLPALLLLFGVGLEDFFGTEGPRVILGGYILDGPGNIIDVYRDGTARGERQRRAEVGARTAEKKAAKALGVGVDEIKKRAQIRWARPLTDEREWRLQKEVRGREVKPNPRARQAIRGHITRQLLEELREELGNKELGIKEET